MPELPEVETTRRALAPTLVGAQVERVTVRQPQLRWPIPPLEPLIGQRLLRLERRAKYLLGRFESGTLLIHLGMSGSLRLLSLEAPPQKHDHVDLDWGNGWRLRYHDPRRFGAILWSGGESLHPLLATLGPEPLAPEFTAAYLAAQCRGKRRAIKLMVMDGAVVVGVGNIYANEALFEAGLAPTTPAEAVTVAQLEQLVAAIQAVIARAIEAGGTTLRDFVSGDGQPGYFQQQLQIYGRGGEGCYRCGATVVRQVLGQRATYHCPHCQRSL